MSATTSIDRDEDIPATNVPATFVNDFYVVLETGGMTRIAFGEKVENAPTHFHTALIMPTEDAKGLANLILDLAKRDEASAGANDASRSK